MSADTASDAWGFVGVVHVGEVEAYRTVEAFATPTQARSEMQSILGSLLGELLAGAEWRRVRDQTGHIPTRRHLGIGMFESPAVPDQISRADADLADGVGRDTE